jgi:hypothetical protein
MVKRILLQIFIFINDTVKSALEVWINGDVNGYICRGSILKRPTYFFLSSYLAPTPSPPLPVSYPCWHTTRFFISLLVLLLSVWQVKPKSTWVPEAGTVAAPCTIMQLCTLHQPGPLTFCLTALLVRQLLQRDGMGILEN